MRDIQSIYLLEPAGSHGVWGLDDFHFLPFLFGASQLHGHKHIRPRVIHHPELLGELRGEYMYLNIISYVDSIKSEGIKWHSPLLNDISGVKSWEKIKEGLGKMYCKEVLGKLPIMQHVRFGSVLQFRASVRSDKEGEDVHMHVYALGQVFPDCCGIRIPSIVAAANKSPSGRIAFMNETLVPFD